MEEGLLLSHSSACPNILPARLLQGSACVALDPLPLNSCQTSLRLCGLPGGGGPRQPLCSPRPRFPSACCCVMSGERGLSCHLCPHRAVSQLPPHSPLGRGCPARRLGVRRRPLSAEIRPWRLGRHFARAMRRPSGGKGRPESDSSSFPSGTDEGVSVGLLGSSGLVPGRVKNTVGFPFKQKDQ